MEKREIKFTNRGFAYIEFKDDYGEECSLSKSSAASEDFIWFGLDNVSAIISQGPYDPARKIGNEDIKKAFNVGRVTNSRMHLSRDQVAALLPILQRFVETGEIHD